MNALYVLLLIGTIQVSGVTMQQEAASEYSCTIPSYPLEMKDPGEVFEGIERRLLSERMVLRFHVTSSGAFAADLQGELELQDDNVLSLKAAGTFGEQDVELRLDSDGTSMTGGNGVQNFDEETPAALRESVALGLTRMGILHNLARLTAGSVPDHAAEGVGDWLVASEIRTGDSTASSPEHIVFDILVTGIKTASAELEVDASNGLPSRRLQTVRFPGGEMNVVEEYSWGT